MNDSRSLAESTMEESTLSKSQSLTKTSIDKRFKGAERDRKDDDNGDETEGEECDAEVWDTLSISFRQVQSVLDKNRTLIQQVNENHQSRIPDNLTKNVPLIREINGNISKVLSMYSDLSVNFSNIVHQRRATTASKRDCGGCGNDKAGSTGN